MAGLKPKGSYDIAEKCELSNEQDARFSLILEELDIERRWDESFFRSSDVLGLLAASAIAEYRAGKLKNSIARNY